MEKSKLISAVLGLSLGVALLGGQALAGPKVYRFDDEYGNKTISHTIPSGRVAVNQLLQRFDVASIECQLRRVKVGGRATQSLHCLKILHRFLEPSVE